MNVVAKIIVGLAMFYVAAMLYKKSQEKKAASIATPKTYTIVTPAKNVAQTVQIKAVD